MVHALRRAHQLVMPDGFVVDVHPTAAPALIEVGAETTGHIEAGDAPQRHAAADAAVRSVVDEGLFRLDAEIEFEFDTYGDTIDELRQFIVANWRSGWIDDATMRRTREALRKAGDGVKPHAREHVRVTRLRPLTQPVIGRP